jgi:hypothetical protein
MKFYTMKISIRGVSPMIWRRLLVPEVASVWGTPYGYTLSCAYLNLSETLLLELMCNMCYTLIRGNLYA